MPIKQGFENWHKEVVNENSAQYANEPNSSTSATNESYITELVAMIKNFDLANSTPMQGLSFIQQLKMEVQRIEKNYGKIITKKSYYCKSILGLKLKCKLISGFKY